MNLPGIRLATPADRETVVGAITLAFSVDPLNRWMMPGPQQFLKYFPKMVEAFVEPSIEAGACFMTDNGEGAAVWFPPGVNVDEARVGAVMEAGVSQALDQEVGHLFSYLEESHPHDDDCWYLPLIGVDVAHQGRGFGAVLMKHVTDLLDEQGALGYLESSNPKNVSLYQRHGFEIISQREFGDTLTITPMLRARR